MTHIQIYKISYKTYRSSSIVQLLMYITVYDKYLIHEDDIEYQIMTYIKRNYDVRPRDVNVKRVITIHGVKDVKSKINSVRNICAKNYGNLIVDDMYTLGYFIFNEENEVAKSISDIVGYCISSFMDK